MQLYIFDILALDGEDLCRFLSLRKKNLARLLARGLTASSLHRSSRVRSGLTCFAPPATWDWRDWCGSAATGPIRPAGRSTGQGEEQAASGDKPGDGGFRLAPIRNGAVTSAVPDAPLSVATPS